MLNKLVDILTSLKLTVVTLSLALGLVFIGTIAQVRLGLWVVQEEYFSSYFVWWGPEGAAWKIPVYPGGYLLGGILLINLIAAHIQRFELSKKKFGIFIIHAGLILLLVGQLVSQLFQVESYMAIEEGDQKNYSESGRASELAIIDLSDTNENTVVAIPQDVLAKNQEIKHPSLPFTLKVQSYYDNANPKLEGTKLGFTKEPFQVAMNKRNIPAATIEIVSDEGSKGPFPVSNWQTEKQLVQVMAESFNRSFHMGLVAPGMFTYQGKPYEIVMRPIRYYKDFTIQLLDFTHDRYMGTEIPKNFSSRVRLKNPDSGEDREVLIYMNNPLRYGGETYYQGGFEPGDTVSILQVVRNPSWLTPYIACVLVSIGLVVQFMYHLVGFAKKRKA
jgi:hypothetical protein